MSYSEYDGLRIENQLCFPLYAASRAIIKKYRPFLSALDLTYTQYITMLVLWQKKTVSVKQLGEMLYLDSGTLTPVLKSLESKGYVRRFRSSADERVLIVELTQVGDALKVHAASIPESIAGCIDLEPDEVIMLHKLLYKLLSDSGKSE